MKTSKLITLASVATFAFALSACTTNSYDCNDTETIHSQQWTKDKEAACAEKNAMNNDLTHTHANGVTHTHEYNGQPHFHNLNVMTYGSDKYASDADVFYESDNDYSRESTLDDLTEDDVELRGKVYDGVSADYTTYDR